LSGFLIGLNSLWLFFPYIFLSYFGPVSILPSE
jgi:hypothetical protein